MYFYSDKKYSKAPLTKIIYEELLVMYNKPNVDFEKYSDKYYIIYEFVVIKFIYNFL